MFGWEKIGWVEKGSFPLFGVVEIKLQIGRKHERENDSSKFTILSLLIIYMFLYIFFSNIYNEWIGKEIK